MPWASRPGRANKKIRYIRGMKPLIVANPSSPMPPHVRGRKPAVGEIIEWGTVLQALEVGQHLVVPDAIDHARARNAVTYWSKRTGRRYAKRGQQVWRVE